MKRQLWKKIAAIGLTFGMLASSMPVGTSADEMIMEDDTYIVAEDVEEIPESEAAAPAEEEPVIIGDEEFFVAEENEEEAIAEPGIEEADGLLPADETEAEIPFDETEILTEETEEELLAASDGVPINTTNFPDDNFRQYVAGECFKYQAQLCIAA